MKKLILIVSLFQLVYSQGVRSINAQQQSTQRITTAYDDTASYFRWGASNGVHTLYIPYNLSPTVDTGGITSLNGLVTSAQTFAIDTTYATSPVFVSSGSVHTLRLPMARINNKLNSADTSIFRTRSDSLYAWTDKVNIFTTPNYFTARQYMTSIGTDTLQSYTPSSVVFVNDTLEVASRIKIGSTTSGVGNLSAHLFIMSDATRRDFVGFRSNNPATYSSGGVTRFQMDTSGSTGFGQGFGNDAMMTVRGINTRKYDLILYKPFVSGIPSNASVAIDTVGRTGIGQDVSSTSFFSVKNTDAYPYLAEFYNSNSTLGAWIDSSFNLGVDTIKSATPSGNVVVKDTLSVLYQIRIGSPTGNQSFGVGHLIMMANRSSFAQYKGNATGSELGVNNSSLAIKHGMDTLGRMGVGQTTPNSGMLGIKGVDLYEYLIQGFRPYGGGTDAGAVFAVDTNGSTGIGTDVSSTGMFAVKNTNTFANLFEGINSVGTSIFEVDSSGGVDATRLWIATTGSGSTESRLMLRNNSTASGTGVELKLLNSTSSGTITNGLSQIRAVRQDDGSNDFTLLNAVGAGGSPAVNFGIDGSKASAYFGTSADTTAKVTIRNGLLADALKLYNSRGTLGAYVDSSFNFLFSGGSYTLQNIPTIGSKPNLHIGANSKLYRSTDTTSSGGTDTTFIYQRLAEKIPYSDTTSAVAMQWELDGKQNKYANITDTSKYLEVADTNYLFAGKLGGWTEIQRTADTATGTFTFVNLGELQFTMDASGVYEIEARIYIVRSTAANGYTIALNCGGTPTNVGIIGESPASVTSGTDMMRTEQITTGTDSLQQAGTTVTTREFATFRGTLTCDGSNRLFTFRVRSEVSASAITYSRGSWLRYRRLY